MLNRSANNHQKQAGFTLVELLVVISLVAIIFVTFASFFTNYLILYSQYQKDCMAYSELSQQSQRVAQVGRGATDIVAADANEMTFYAYFSPVDSYVSQVRYYLNPSKTALLVDVIPMTANPPNGSLINGSKKTYTIISNFYQPSGGTLFNYYDSSATAINLPITDQHTIQSVQVNIAAPGSHTKNGQNLSVTVSLRNRKTNL